MQGILREIGMIARCLDTISNVEFKEYSLSKGQYLYLVRICENPGIIQEKLAEMIKVDRTTAARAIQKLEQQGMIYKSDHPENKKILNLYPSERGEKLYAFLQMEERHSMNVALEGFSPAEIETALLLLRRMRENIEEDWKLIKKGEKRAYMDHARAEIARKEQ
ncbi:MarR family winged helix-turn-helix transcriptional regulator [Paenibacillus pinihumi]|uniref:MarR family winged helix-turn-helix transcriptional regulator n=1 Tax=Paenibacillus pinihumi TaxID=669462 RepID=UPI0004298913|nr:MarR family transcriptional regulator [Paenibacillus pinihumi]